MGRNQQTNSSTKHSGQSKSIYVKMQYWTAICKFELIIPFDFNSHASRLSVLVVNKLLSAVEILARIYIVFTENM